MPRAVWLRVEGVVWHLPRGLEADSVVVELGVPPDEKVRLVANAPLVLRDSHLKQVGTLSH